MRTRLFTPGPTQIPEAVRFAALQGNVYHRSPAFREVFQQVLADLQYFFQTKQEVLVLTCSGTGGMEACVSNLLRRGEKVLVLEGGKFGERWSEISKAYGLEVITMKIPWGHSPDLEALRKLLRQDRNVAAVFCNHSETSTGALTDIKTVAALVHELSEALVIVDGVTAVGVLPFDFDAWQIDVCVSGSQKGAMSPTGLAFVALSDRAWQKHQSSDLPHYYFDFTKAHEAALEGGTSWTPAINAILGLAESLQRIRARGLENMWRHYARMAHATRAGMRALGLEILPQHPSDALTTIKAPSGIDGKELVRILREQHGLIVAGGQGQLKGKIMRVTNMGDYDHLDMIALLAAVEMTLQELSWKFEWGAGLAAMQRAYNENKSS